MIFEAGLDGVTFYSQGEKLLGGLYRAAGRTPCPTAILLHGVPGVEKNLDLAYVLRDAGWNCLLCALCGENKPRTTLRPEYKTPAVWACAKSAD